MRKRTQDEDGERAGTGTRTGTRTGTEAETRERTQGENGDGSGDRAGTGTGAETGTAKETVVGAEAGAEMGTRTEREWGGRRRALVSATPGKKQSRRPGTAIPHAASSILYTINCRQLTPAGSQQLRAQDPAPARRCGTEGRTGHQGREGGNGDGTGTGAGTGMRASTGMDTRIGMGVRTGAGTGTTIETRVERRESLGTYEMVIEVGRKTREGGRRQRVTSNLSRKTRRPSKTVESCRGPELRDGRRGSGSGRAEERRRSAKENRGGGQWGDSGGRRTKRREESVGSRDVDRGYLGSSKEAVREV